MVSKTEPQVDSITDDLSNVALSTNKSRDLDNTNANELFNRKPNVLVDNKIFPTKIDDQFDINLSASRSNCIADNKTSTGKLDDTSDTKPRSHAASLTRKNVPTAATSTQRLTVLAVTKHPTSMVLPVSMYDTVPESARRLTGPLIVWSVRTCKPERRSSGLPG